MTIKLFLIYLLGFSLIHGAPVFCQSQAEIDQVTTITKRVQTNCSALIFIAGLAQTNGDYKKAESCYKKILDLYKTDPGIGPKSAKYAWILSRIALCDLKLEENSKAAKQSKEALVIIDGQTPDNNPDEGNFIIMTRQNCAVILGKSMPPLVPAKPPELRLKSIALTEIPNLKEREKQVQGFLHTAEQKKSGSAYMKDLLYLANVYTLEKKNTEAEPLFKRAISLAEKKSGKNSPELLTPLANYGYLLQQAGKQKEAGEILSRMEQIRNDAESQAHSQISAKP